MLTHHVHACFHARPKTQPAIENSISDSISDRGPGVTRHHGLALSDAFRCTSSCQQLSGSARRLIRSAVGTCEHSYAGRVDRAPAKPDALPIVESWLLVPSTRSSSSKIILVTARGCIDPLVMTGAELAALARQAQIGDPVAREQLLVELYEPIRKHIYLMLGSDALVEDAVQDTMTALYRGLAGFRGDTASPKTWALAIATRVAHRLCAREARYQLVEDGTADVGMFDLAPAAAAEFAMLQRALATLTPKKRDAFVLMAIFELSAEEAGEVLEIPANTAASQYRSARAELHARFKRFDEPVRAGAAEVPGPVES